MLDGEHETDLEREESFHQVIQRSSWVLMSHL